MLSDRFSDDCSIERTGVIIQIPHALHEIGGAKYNGFDTKNLNFSFGNAGMVIPLFIKGNRRKYKAYQR